ncbi:hypothetical protein D0Q02_30525 [Micromonospora craniellae]|uniref:Uncharacterized protein n=1 Tax=Micromonospora craniellae TaxID=2294034 RepID=A0A372FQD4_9ACTN|nr:hypothetical protein D0Q02_30525 [Micromonospora craniellae]
MVVSTYGRDAPVTHALPSDFRSAGALASVLNVMASFGEEWLNLFQWFLVPSSTARRPTVRSDLPLLAASFTIVVTLNSIAPEPRQPCAAPCLRSPRTCAVRLLSQVGWLFQVVLDEIAPVFHNFALLTGLHVHACFCSIRNSALLTSVPFTRAMFIRNKDRMM